MGARWQGEEKCVVRAKESNGSQIIEVHLAIILYCNGEPLKIFKEGGGMLIHIYIAFFRQLTLAVG